MKNITKKIISSVLLSSVLCTTACGSTGEVPQLMNFRNTDASAVVAMIDAISEATFETEAAIEAAYVAYCELEDDTQAQVTNFERLKTLRDEIADLYETKRVGDRVDRSKILIGSYNVNFIEEEDIKAIADCGIDFMTGVHKFEALDLMAKYGIGAFTHVIYHKFPYFRGNDRVKGEAASPAPTYDEAYLREVLPDISTFDHEALWGIWLVDEPNSGDYPFHEMQRAVMQEKYPHILTYINLYPNCGYDRLGVTKGSSYSEYKEYIDEYVKTVNSEYICYDRYMYRNDGGDLDGMLVDTSIIAKACRENNREFWMWLQANFPEDNGRTVSVDQMKFQANLAMSFGVTSMIWGCWAPGWWYNNVLDSEGNKTEQYDKLKVVNAETNILSPVIIKYNSLDNCIIGHKHPDASTFYSNDDNVIEQDTFIDVSMVEHTDSSVLCGYFEKKIGNGSAMMFVNITDPDCETKETAPVFFKVSNPDAVVTEHTAHGSFVLKPDADGYYKISVENAEYSFVTVE